MSVVAFPSRRIRGIGRFYMGQAPEIKPRPDMDHVLTQDEIMQIRFDGGDEAINYYKFLTRIISLMTKVAFVTDFWKTLKVSPELLGAMGASEDGRAWLEAFTNSEAAFLSFTQPNYFRSLNLVRNYMETVVLPKQYGIDVKGRLPAFLPGMMDLSYSDVVISGPGAMATFDFGDLQKTTVKEDIDVVNDLADKFKVKPQLGLATAAIVVISIAAVLIAAFLYAGWVDYLETRKIPPEVRKIIEKADPQQLERILEKWGKVGGLFGGVADIFMWGAIGLGVIVVGGITWYIATK